MLRRVRILLWKLRCLLRKIRGIPNTEFMVVSRDVNGFSETVWYNEKGDPVFASYWGLDIYVSQSK
jgi:hypothetical protein